VPAIQGYCCRHCWAARWCCEPGGGPVITVFGLRLLRGMRRYNLLASRDWVFELAWHVAGAVIAGVLLPETDIEQLRRAVLGHPDYASAGRKLRGITVSRAGDRCPALASNLTSMAPGESWVLQSHQPSV